MTDDGSATFGADGEPASAASGAPARNGEQIEVLPAQSADEAEDGEQDVMSQVEQPAKVMRIGTMIKQLLDEV
ncbi:MAG TPA: proteasome activator, partial [Jatrophihabitans sp.]|nr:proteasome activator [Jatrophihabitans sp.]